jgi:putative glutamine amidotransferase
MVNSTHHQAVKDLGKDLTPIAFSDDGVIEAIESNVLPIAAVQWHNERLVGEPFDRLFAEINKWTRGD